MLACTSIILATEGAHIPILASRTLADDGGIPPVRMQWAQVTQCPLRYRSELQLVPGRGELWNLTCLGLCQEEPNLREERLPGLEDFDSTVHGDFHSGHQCVVGSDGVGIALFEAAASGFKFVLVVAIFNLKLSPFDVVCFNRLPERLVGGEKAISVLVVRRASPCPPSRIQAFLKVNIQKCHTPRIREIRAIRGIPHRLHVILESTPIGVIVTGSVIHNTPKQGQLDLHVDGLLVHFAKLSCCRL